jgi:hypothetical protein
VTLAAGAAALGAWQVDDAGITFAYARNLASGHGLVSQPGLAPVEGFSNPLWTLLVAAMWKAGVFSAQWTSKALAFAFDSLTLWLIARDLARRAASFWGVALPLVLLAACPPLVIWTFSGLENALLALLVTSLVITSVGVGPPRDRRAGVLAGLIALTRPDGIVWLALHPLTIAIEEWRRARGPDAIAPIARRIVHVLVGFVPVFGAWMVFRLAYYGDWAPNTLHAKQGPSISSMLSPSKIDALVAAVGGDAGWLLVLAAFAVIVRLARHRRLETRTITLVVATCLGAVVHLVLPTDWMGELRFATPFFVLAFWTLGELALAWRASIVLTAPQRWVVAAVVAIGVAQALAIAAGRTLTFAACPAVPLDTVRSVTTRGFNALSAEIGGERALLTPDLGGQLLDSRLRVYDLAGLCDRRIAGELSSAGGTARLHDYLLDEARPTFVHISGAFVRLAGLHRDPRFARDYAPLYESWRRQGFALAAFSATEPWWGDYVRRDAVGGDAARLDALRAAHRRLGMTAWDVWELPPTRSSWPRLPRALGTLRAWSAGESVVACPSAR